MAATPTTQATTMIAIKAGFGRPDDLFSFPAGAAVDDAVVIDVLVWPVVTTDGPLVGRAEREVVPEAESEVDWEVGATGAVSDAEEDGVEEAAEVRGHMGVNSQDSTGEEVDDCAVEVVSTTDEVGAADSVVDDVVGSTFWVVDLVVVSEVGITAVVVVDVEVAFSEVVEEVTSVVETTDDGPSSSTVPFWRCRMTPCRLWIGRWGCAAAVARSETTTRAARIVCRWGCVKECGWFEEQ